LEELD
jgi:predicted Zn-dependent peptidase